MSTTYACENEEHGHPTPLVFEHRDDVSAHVSEVEQAWTDAADAAADAAEHKLSGTPCPACGRIDWLADHRQANGQIACYCDDCGYAVRVSL